jgi:hypothetical protein
MTSSANSYQVGGDHYDTPYIHWDFVIDTELHYLLACATKYGARWRTKYDTWDKQAEDLGKTLHYIIKAKESGIYACLRPEKWAYSHRFIDQLDNIYDQSLMKFILDGDYDNAENAIIFILAEGATAAYVDQD